MSSTRTAKLPSHALILEQDLRSGGCGESRGLDILKGTAISRGHRKPMKRLPGLPHTTARKAQLGPCEPEDLYVHHEAEVEDYSSWYGTFPRMVSRSDPLDDILIYVHGSCLNQHISGDTNQRRAGCAVVFRPVPDPTVVDPFNPSGTRSFEFRLESRGPTGQFHPQTSNRAELRAAIAALECRYWIGEGRISITIATNSAYMVEGITKHIATWLERGWCTSTGKLVANRDLWEKLLSRINLLAHWGCEVRFWKIPKALNTCAHAAAKHAAKHQDTREGYSKVLVAGM